MKVYSWKNLLVTLFLGGGLTVLSLWKALHGDPKQWIWVALCLYLMASGLWASLTREGYERDRERGERYDRVMRRLFGRFASIMPFTPALLFLLCCCTSFLRPPVWLFLLLMVGVVAYAAWFSWYIQRAVNRERTEEERQTLLNESDKE